MMNCSLFLFCFIGISVSGGLKIDEKLLFRLVVPLKRTIICWIFVSSSSYYYVPAFFFLYLSVLRFVSWKLFNEQ